MSPSTDRPGAGTNHVLWAVVRRLSRGSGSGRARGLLRLWRSWEWIASRLWPASHIPGGRSDVLRIRFTRYHGPKVTLPDGTIVSPGDAIGEIHLDNRVLAAVTTASRWGSIRPVREDLIALAAWMRTQEFPRDLVAFYGQTLVGRAAQIVGFSIIPRPGTLRVTRRDRLEQIYMQGLLQIYTHEGAGRLDHGRAGESYPVDTWMSRSELLRLYGDPNAEQARRVSAPADAAAAGSGKTRSPRAAAD